jgi:hypothetical protein
MAMAMAIHVVCVVEAAWASCFGPAVKGSIEAQTSADRSIDRPINRSLAAVNLNPQRSSRECEVSS